MLTALVVISALSFTPAENALPQEAVQLFDSLPLDVRWQLVQQYYHSTKATDKQLAEQLFSRFSDAERKQIRRQFAARQKLPSHVTTLRHDTAQHDAKHATNLDELEEIRKQVLMYLGAVYQDALAENDNRTSLAIKEIERFVDAYTLCKRDASPSHVDNACRRGEYCIKILRSLYGQ